MYIKNVFSIAYGLIKNLVQVRHFSIQLYIHYTCILFIFVYQTTQNLHILSIQKSTNEIKNMFGQLANRNTWCIAISTITYDCSQTKDHPFNSPPLCAGCCALLISYNILPSNELQTNTYTENCGRHTHSIYVFALL